MAFSDYEYDRKTKTITVKSGVKEIPNCAFLGNQKVRHVLLPQSVERIGEKAFCNCKNLISVELDDQLKWIGDEAFLLCEGLQTVVLPDGLQQLGACAFSACPKAKIYVSKSNPELCQKVRASFAPDVDTFATEETESQIVFKDINHQNDISVEKAFEILNF